MTINPRIDMRVHYVLAGMAFVIAALLLFSIYSGKHDGSMVLPLVLLAASFVNFSFGWYSEKLALRQAEIAGEDAQRRAMAFVASTPRGPQ